MFDGFVSKKITVGDIMINLVQGGSGQPVLLLHGYPQTHVCWHLVAPILARNFTVVCADLRGCGDSSKPAAGGDHAAYSKRSMANDQVEMMRQLGFGRFAVVGHDPGARVAHRLALDHPDRVTKLVLLDIIPTSTAFENVDKEIASNAFNWFFSIQEDGLPERLIGAERLFYLRWCIKHWSGTDGIPVPEAMAAYERCFDEETIHATCEEFRAAASIDLEHDRIDKNFKVQCPTLVLWSKNSLWASFDIIEVWKTKAEQVTGKAFDCGHFLPEENGEETAGEIGGFLLKKLD